MGQAIPIDLLQGLYLPNSPHLRQGGSEGSEEERGRETGEWPKSVAFTSTLTFPPTRRLPTKDRKRILVTGGAGFVGSHLVDRLMFLGHDVVGWFGSFFGQ